MSSGTTTPPPQMPETPVATRPGECEGIIEQRLRETQQRVKGVDVAVGLITLAIGVLVYLLLAAAIDHWLIVGGLGFWGRLALWFGLLGGTGTYFALYVLPAIRNRINPVFAAATIEQSQQSLKNSLINFLLLRGRRQDVAAPIFQAMERRAAADLTSTEIDIAVDRSHLIRLGCVLLGILVVFSVYLVASPKNPLRSAARILWPWSSIEASTRVTIHDVRPGNATVFHGDFATVSAEIAGLREGEQAVVIYSSADGQTVDQTIPLTLPEGEHRYQCRLPPGNLGLQQTYTYRLAAGDCRTARYRIEVQTAPAIVVDKVSYHYPAYTRMADRVVERQGDLSAVEGTEVTIEATANTEIQRNSAEIDLGCTGQHGRRMNIDGRTAVGHFTLRTNPKDATGPEYDVYQLRFADLQDRENQQPIRHRIEVIRDLPPEIQLVEPEAKDTPVPLNGRQPIRVTAKDPDFGLRQVLLRAQVDGKDLTIAPLFEQKSTENARSGEFAAEYFFEPAKLGLKVNDRVAYWAEAEDNKEPTANRTTTEKQWITVVGSDAQQPGKQERPEQAKNDGAGRSEKGRSQDQKADNRSDEQGSADNTQEDKPQDAKRSDNAQPDQQGSPEQSPPEKSDQPKAGEQSDKSESGQGDGQGGAGKSGQEQGQQKGDKQGDGGQNGEPSGEKRGERIDPDTAPGDAIQEILNDRQKEQEKQDQKGGKGQSSDGQGKGQQPQQAEKQQSDNQQREGEQPQTGDKQQGQEGQQGQGNQQPDGEKSDKKNGGKQSNEQKGNDKQDGKGSNQKMPKGGGAGQAGDGDSAGDDDSAGNGEKQRDGKGDGGKKSDGKQPGQKPSGNAKPSEGQGGAGQGSKGEKADQQNEGHDQTSDDTEGTTTGKGITEKKPDTEKPGTGKPDTDKPGTERSGSKAGGKTEKPSGSEKKPGEKQPDNQNSPGAGEDAGEEHGAPMPQTDNDPRQKKPGKSSDATGEKKGDQAQSPGTSKRQSDSKGDTAGDRTGGGAKGGGQQANQEGVGGSGTHTPDDEGGSAADEQGNGEISNKPGDQAAAKKPTGSDKQQATPGGREGDAAGPKQGKGSNGKPTGPNDQMPGQEPPGGQSASQEDSAGQGMPQQNPAEGGTPGKSTSQGPQTPGTGSPTAGGRQDDQSESQATPESVDSEAEQANLEYAQRQTALALEYLRDQLAKDKPEVLDRLGWTREDAKHFIARWDEMQRAAAQKGSAGDAARKHLSDTLRSLGLRPRGTELRRGGLKADQPENLRDAGRFAPPPDWAEQFREYTKGVSGGERKEK